jgi:hypothetical protein
MASRCHLPLAKMPHGTNRERSLPRRVKSEVLRSTKGEMQSLKLITTVSGDPSEEVKFVKLFFRLYR